MYFFVLSLQNKVCILCIKYISVWTRHISCAQKSHCVTHPTLLHSTDIKAPSLLHVTGLVRFMFLELLQSDIKTQLWDQLTLLTLASGECDQTNFFKLQI